MQYDEFVGKVQNRGRMSSREEAVEAIRATFETLAERLAGGTPENVAAQLPRGLGDYLRRDGEGERFSADDFIERVADRSHVDEPAGAWYTRVVLDVLRDAVTDGTIEHVIQQLPDDYAPLFEAGSEGEMQLH